jgi:hypothetical protein
LEPTVTDTPLPTNTPKPTNTLTPTPESKLELGERLEVIPGGFSFQPIQGYDNDVDGAGLGVFDQDGMIIISIYGVTTYSGEQTYEEIIDEFLAEIEARGAGKFEKGEAYSITVDKIEGIAFDLTGTMFESPLEGQTILVMPKETQFLYGLAIANVGIDKDKWEKEGSRIFETLLETIKFIDMQDFEGSACLVSTDNTYGYTKDNPIKVGGDWFDGPARERAYLDALSGPNGEIVSYERNGSLNYGDTILDEYTVRYAEETVILYLDEYTYEELMAPVGFTCWVPIPLSSP